MSNEQKSVFELVEWNDQDDNYYTHGMFLSLPDAVAHAEDAGVNVCHCAEQFVRIDIRERPIGPGDDYKTVWSRSWSQDYETEDSLLEWKITSTELPKP